MVDPSTLAAPLSPRALAAAQHVTAIEAELVQLRADVAPTLERIAALERSLEAVELAAHPKQVALLDIGEALPPVPPLREPSRMAEQLLRRAVALAAEGEVGMPRLVIARDAVSRGELKCAHALAAGVRPLLVEESRAKGSVVYRLTADGETVARALRADRATLDALTRHAVGPTGAALAVLRWVCEGEGEEALRPCEGEGEMAVIHDGEESEQ